MFSWPQVRWEPWPGQLRSGSGSAHPIVLSNQGAALAHAAPNQERRELRPEPAGAQRAQSRERGSGGAAAGTELRASGGGAGSGWGAGGGADLTDDAGTLLSPRLVSTTRGRERPRRRRWTAGGAGREVLAPCISERRVPSQRRAPPHHQAGGPEWGAGDEGRLPPYGIHGESPVTPTFITALLASRCLSLRSKSTRATSLS